MGFLPQPCRRQYPSIAGLVRFLELEKPLRKQELHRSTNSITNAPDCHATSHFIPALSKIYGDASPKLYRCIPGRRLDPKAHRNGLRVFGIYDARPHSCRTFPDLVRGEWSLVARMWQMPEKATFCPIAYNTLEAFKDEVDFKK